MPADPTNPARPRPSHPDEADLLAFIEGAALPRDRELAVARALEADPKLARRLAAMRADCAALRSLPPVAAPAGMIDAVEAALQPVLERKMLLGLRDGEPLQSRPPVSVVQPARRSILATIFAERAGRYSALAAGLLLLVGGASYWAATSLWPSTPAKSVTIATADAERQAPQAGSDGGTSDGKTERLASAGSDGAAPPTPPAPNLAAPGVETPPALADRGADPEGASANALAAAPAALFTDAATPDETPLAASGGMTNDHAILLARESRLVIRLRAPDPVVLAQPERIADQIRRAQSASWRLGEPAPTELVAVLNAAQPVPLPDPVRSIERETTIVGEDLGFDPPEFVGPPAPDTTWMPPPASTVYLVQTRLEGAALDSLRNALAPFGEATLEEAHEPLPLDDSFNPAAVVWWSQPPAGWTSWASVPVVIDQAR